LQALEAKLGKKIFLRDFWLAWNLAPTRARSRLGTSSGTTEVASKKWEKKFFFATSGLLGTSVAARNRARSQLGTSSGTTKVASEVGKKNFFFATSGLLGT
jgi:hypothetical protein